MLDKFTQFIERHLAGPMEKLGSQRHLRAVRDGIVSTFATDYRQLIFL